MKIKKMYLKSNTRQDNFRTFEERDILNPRRKHLIDAWDCTSSKKPLNLVPRAFPSGDEVESLCVLSSGRRHGGAAAGAARG